MGDEEDNVPPSPLALMQPMPSIPSTASKKALHRKPYRGSYSQSRKSTSGGNTGGAGGGRGNNGEEMISIVIHNEAKSEKPRSRRGSLDDPTRGSISYNNSSYLAGKGGKKRNSQTATQKRRGSAQFGNFNENSNTNVDTTKGNPNNITFDFNTSYANDGLREREAALANDSESEGQEEVAELDPAAQSPLNVALIKQLKEELKSELKRDLALALEDRKKRESSDHPHHRPHARRGGSNENATEMMPLGAAAAAIAAEEEGEGEERASGAGLKPDGLSNAEPEPPNLDPDPPPEIKMTEHNLVRSPSTDDFETLPTFDHYVPSATRVQHLVDSYVRPRHTSVNWIKLDNLDRKSVV